MRMLEHAPVATGTSRHGLRKLLEDRWRSRRFVCVGLDSDYHRLPAPVRAGSVRRALVTFNREIVEATHESVCAYKPNAAFYERHGAAGVEALIETVHWVKETLPDVAVILDAKRGDIGNTNTGYVSAAFDLIGVDAITVHPYLGKEALAPFLDRTDRGVFVLVKTSNAGAGEFQDLPVGPEQRPLYEHVARAVATSWNDDGNCGVVVGAPYPRSLRAVREIVGDMPILVPGVGAQGAEIGPTVLAGRDSRGYGLVVNSARDIIYASTGSDYARAASRAAAALNREIIRFAEE